MAKALPSTFQSGMNFESPIKKEKFSSEEEDNELIKGFFYEDPHFPHSYSSASLNASNFASSSVPPYFSYGSGLSSFGNSFSMVHPGGTSFNFSPSPSSAHQNSQGSQISQQLPLPSTQHFSQIPLGFSGCNVMLPTQHQQLSLQQQMFLNSFPHQQNSNSQQILQFMSQFNNSNGSDEQITEDKKRRPNRTFVRRVRQTRPKVVESKGAIQCKGKNRKKGTQCRNAALMEYMGPRPIYCAEHIELDPKSLYEKCKAGYQKERGDNKNCKEVVLKEFGLCYKHYSDSVDEMLRTNNLAKAMKHQARIESILSQLESEAAAAKRKDGDLYQRKNKLIPKFQEMKRTINKGITLLKSKEDKEGDTTTPLSADEYDIQSVDANKSFVTLPSESEIEELKVVENNDFTKSIPFPSKVFEGRLLD